MPGTPPIPDRPRSATTGPPRSNEKEKFMGTVKVAIVGVGNCAASLV
ncbi:MAG: hypothetical protein ACLGI3_02270 [Actinomycetes bacterium]